MKKISKMLGKMLGLSALLLLTQFMVPLLPGVPAYIRNAVDLSLTAHAAAEQVSGTVNASTLTDNADLVLVGNTVLNMDVAKTLSSISGKDYDLTISGSNKLTVNRTSEGTGIHSNDLTVNTLLDVTTKNGYGIKSECICTFNASTKVNASNYGIIAQYLHTNGSDTVVEATGGTNGMDINYVRECHGTIKAKGGMIGILVKGNLSSGYGADCVIEAEGTDQAAVCSMYSDLPIYGKLTAKSTGKGAGLATGSTVAGRFNCEYDVDIMENADVTVTTNKDCGICGDNVYIYGKLTVRSGDGSYGIYASDFGVKGQGIVDVVSTGGSAIRTHWFGGGVERGAKLTAKGKEYGLYVTGASSRYFYGDVTLEGKEKAAFFASTDHLLINGPFKATSENGCAVKIYDPTTPVLGSPNLGHVEIGESANADIHGGLEGIETDRLIINGNCKIESDTKTAVRVHDGLGHFLKVYSPTYMSDPIDGRVDTDNLKILDWKGEDEVKYASFVRKYTVSFNNKYHGTKPDDQTDIKYDEKAEKPDDLTETGWTFLGWYDNDKFTGEPYDFNTPVRKDLILYAKWERTRYTVTFEMNGATSAAVPAQTLYLGDTAKKPADPRKTGFDFLGWYTNGACTDLYDFNTPVTADVELYAGWGEPCTITFVKKESGVDLDITGSMASETVYKGRYYTLPACGFTCPEGYKFRCWNLSNWGYTSEGAYMRVTESITVTAVWERIPNITVTFDNKGHGYTPEAQVFHDYSKVTKPTPSPTEEGWTFNGWYKDPGCSVGNTWNFSTEKAEKSMTLYARWEPVTHPSEYSVELQTIGLGYGTAVLDKTMAAANSQITVTCTPAPCYKVTRVSFDTDNGSGTFIEQQAVTNPESNTVSFTTDWHGYKSKVWVAFGRNTAVSHSLQHHAAVPATCTKRGIKEYWECTKCGILFQDAEGTKELSSVSAFFVEPMHTRIHHEPESGVCAYGAEKDYYECSACGKLFEYDNDPWDPDYVELSAEETARIHENAETHTWGAPIYTWSADYSECTATRVCTRNPAHKQVETVSIDRTKLTKYPSCTESVTTKVTSESFSNPAFEVQTKEDAELPATGHSLTFHDYKAPTMKDAGNVAYYECDTCRGLFYNVTATQPVEDDKDVVIPRIEDENHKHTMKHHPQVEATATQDGMKEYWECTGCGRWYSDSAGTNEVFDLSLLVIKYTSGGGGGNGGGDDVNKKDETVTPDDSTDGTVTPDDSTDGTVTPDDSTDGTVTPDDSTDGTVTPDDSTDGTVTPDKDDTKEGEKPSPTKSESTVSGGSITIGGIPVPVTATVSYTNTIEYTGEKIIPSKKLEAEVDRSSLISAARSLMTVDKDASKLFTVSWVAEDNKSAGTGRFYAKIKLNEKKAKSWGIKGDALQELKKAVKAINKQFRDNPQTFTITPVNVDASFKSAKGSFTKKGKLKLSWIKVMVAGKAKKLNKKQYKIISEDPVAKTITIEGKGNNFTGTKVISLN